MILQRCMAGMAFGLLLASCASQGDTSKYLVSQLNETVPAVPSSTADVNPDGTLNEFPVGSPSGHDNKHPTRERSRTRSDSSPRLVVQQSRPAATSGTERPAIRTGLRPPQPEEPVTVGAVSARNQPRFETPVKGSDRWKKEEAENEKLEKQLNERLRNAICTKC